MSFFSKDMELYPKIPQEDMVVILDFLVNMTVLMQARKEKNLAKYQAALEKINPRYRQLWHLLAAHGAQFILMLFNQDLTNRIEILRLKRSQLWKLFEEELLFWKLERLGRRSGIILYSDNGLPGYYNQGWYNNSGFNPGIYLEEYLSILNSASPFVFQAIEPHSATFDVHNLDATNIYMKIPMNEHRIDGCMRTLCMALDIPVLLNPSITISGENYHPGEAMDYLQCPFNYCTMSFSNLDDVVAHLEGHEIDGYDDISVAGGEDSRLYGKIYRTRKYRDGKPYKCILKRCDWQPFQEFMCVLIHFDEDHPHLKKGGVPDLSLTMLLQKNLQDLPKKDEPSTSTQTTTTAKFNATEDLIRPEFREQDDNDDIDENNTIAYLQGCHVAIENDETGPYNYYRCPTCSELFLAGHLLLYHIEDIHNGKRLPKGNGKSSKGGKKK